MADIRFRSKADGRSFAAPLPTYGFTAAVEEALLSRSVGYPPGTTLTARVEPAFADGIEEIVAFAIVAESDEAHEGVLGMIPTSASAVTGAICDAWERVLLREGRDVQETADYVLTRSAPAPPAAPAGIRIVGAPREENRFTFRVPPIRRLDFEAAVSVGETGQGLVERVFEAHVFQELKTFFAAERDRERMGALHGELWLSPGEDHQLTPYVLYEQFVPLEGRGDAASIHISAHAQAASVGQTLGLAALIHSHPYLTTPDQKAAAQEASESQWGLVSASGTDLMQLRRALPHVHQATIIAALPREVGKPLCLVPYGYGPGGRVEAEYGFWLADVTGQYTVPRGRTGAAVKKEVTPA
jgi:hypothetical protein